MLKFVVTQPGMPPQEISVPGHSASVGRAPSCDVVINQQVVSKQHLRILHGTVVVDLGSINGTFVEGNRLSGACLIEGRPLALGQSGIELRVESEEVPGEATSPDAAPDADLENFRSEYALLESEAARLRRELAAWQEGAGTQEELVASLTSENEALRGRLDSLKRDLEERETDDGDSVQARLAMQRVESVNELNEGLSREVERLKAELQALSEEQPEPEVANEFEYNEALLAEKQELEEALKEMRVELMKARGDLEQERSKAGKHTDQTNLVRKLRKELEALQQAAPAAPAGGADLQQAREELVALRTRIAELEGQAAAAAPAAGNPSDLFFKLQADNAELRRKLAAFESAGGDAPAAAPESKYVKELMEARLRITALESEISNLKVAQPAPAPATPAAPTPGRAAAPPVAASGSGTIRDILDVLVDRDVDALSRASGGSAEEFVLVESLRFMRHAERVVTRVAGDLIQLFMMERTMLPDTSGSYRDHVADLLRDASSSSAQRGLVEYLENLARWLVAAVGAHRKAAVLFAEQIKKELTEERLTSGESLPAYARVPMLAGNELWRRAQEYLQSLSPDIIDERIDELARRQAQRIVKENTAKLD